MLYNLIFVFHINLRSERIKVEFLLKDRLSPSENPFDLRWDLILVSSVHNSFDIFFLFLILDYFSFICCINVVSSGLYHILLFHYYALEM